MEVEFTVNHDYETSLQPWQDSVSKIVKKLKIMHFLKILFYFPYTVLDSEAKGNENNTKALAQVGTRSSGFWFWL